MREPFVFFTAVLTVLLTRTAGFLVLQSAPDWLGYLTLLASVGLGALIVYVWFFGDEQPATQHLSSRHHSPHAGRRLRRSDRESRVESRRQRSS
jgi:hypothetical protein